MKKFILLTVMVLSSVTVLLAQIDHAKTETVKIDGLCNMCETAIENAAKKKKVSMADWNEQTKLATITYNSKRTDLDAILKNIALAGYDNQHYLAPDDAYAVLPGCCKYERQRKHAVKTNSTFAGSDLTAGKQDHTGHTQESNMGEASQTNPFTKIFDSYFSIKDALVKTEGATAAASAASLLTALQAIDMGKLKMEVHDVWMKIEKPVKSDAQHIKENLDTEHQREHFISLSKNMYELVKASKPAGTMYYQFCPMANDGKGAHWLSKESAIKNPYYGSEMLSCGKTIETIKQ